jgi:nucleoside phosphorylase
VDVGIITIRADEFTAVLQRLPEKQPPLTGRRRYRVRRLQLSDNEYYTIAVVRCVEQGNGEAQAAARDLLEDLGPTWLFVVGIAGGVPDNEFSLGDVIVSTRIADFSVESVLHDQSREYALAGGPVHPDVVKWVADIAAMTEDGELGNWNEEAAIRMAMPEVDLREDNFYGDTRDDVRDKLLRRFAIRRPPLVFAGAIASSDRLVKDDELLRVWRKFARQIQAVEMESAGIYRAAHGRQIPFVAIRGISDVIGHRRRAEWTEYACQSAAAFMLAFLRTRPIPPRAHRSRGSCNELEAAPSNGLDAARFLEALFNGPTGDILANAGVPRAITLDRLKLELESTPQPAIGDVYQRDDLAEIPADLTHTLREYWWFVQASSISFYASPRSIREGHRLVAGENSQEKKTMEQQLSMIVRTLRMSGKVLLTPLLQLVAPADLPHLDGSWAFFRHDFRLPDIASIGRLLLPGLCDGMTDPGRTASLLLSRSDPTVLPVLELQSTDALAIRLNLSRGNIQFHSGTFSVLRSLLSGESVRICGLGRLRSRAGIEIAALTATPR